MVNVRNPHSVLAALKSRPKDVTQIHMPASHKAGEAWDEVIRLAQQRGIPVAKGARGPAPGGRDPRRGGPSQNDGRESVAEANIREKEPVSAEELFENAPERSGGKGLWLALDNLQDPHNVGAIFRAAAFFGVQGIVMTEERSAPMTGTVYDVSCGGVEHVPFTLQTNLQRAFEVAKESGLWILGSSEHANDRLESIPRDRPWLLVLGNEEKGMRRLTEESCDMLCKIAPRGQVTSLNVSVAAGILISSLSQ